MPDLTSVQKASARFDHKRTGDMVIQSASCPGCSVHRIRVLEAQTLLIQSRNLLPYLNQLQYPVQILTERGDQVATTEDRKGLLMLIEMNMVVGAGTGKRLRRLMFNAPLREIADSTAIKRALSLSTYMGKSDVFQDQMAGGQRVWTFKSLKNLKFQQEKATDASRTQQAY